MKSNLIYNTLKPDEHIDQRIIFPIQTHSTRIVDLSKPYQNTDNSDGLITTYNSGELLGIKTADCAPIVFIGNDYYGIVHAGWRGLVGYNNQSQQIENTSIIENMLILLGRDIELIWIGPSLHQFQIQKDFCYDAINEKMGSSYFIINNKGEIIFNFIDALLDNLPTDITVNSGINTATSEYASWRRDKSKDKQNLTYVGLKK